MLKFIKASSHLPWMCIGDFNKVLLQSEHEGVQERSRSQIVGFQEMVDVYGLVDLGFEDRRWTYEKKVAGGSYCRVRLDRSLACDEWSAIFSLAYVHYLTSAASDHGPIELRWEARPQKSLGRQGKRPFLYELICERHSDFRNVVAQAWTDQPRATNLEELHMKLGAVSRCLGGWNNQEFGNVKRELKDLNARLEKLRYEPLQIGHLMRRLRPWTG
jgi:hypothetical protein